MEILGIIKQSKIKQGTWKFFMENPHTNCVDKKPRGLKPLIYNPLFDIKVHKFTLLFYPKDLLDLWQLYLNLCPRRSTINTLVDSSQPLRGYRSFQQLKFNHMNSFLRDWE